MQLQVILSAGPINPYISQTEGFSFQNHQRLFSLTASCSTIMLSIFHLFVPFPYLYNWHQALSCKLSGASVPLKQGGRPTISVLK